VAEGADISIAAIGHSVNGALKFSREAR
jgi:hypothetical protein